MSTPVLYTIRSKRDDGGVVAIRVSEEEKATWSLDGQSWKPLYAYSKDEGGGGGGGTYTAGKNIEIKGNVISAINSIYDTVDKFLEIEGLGDYSYRIHTKNIQYALASSNTITVSTTGNKNTLNIKIAHGAPFSTSTDGLSLKLSDNSSLTMGDAGLAVSYDPLTLKLDSSGRISVNLSTLQTRLTPGTGIKINNSTSEISCDITAKSETGIYFETPSSTNNITVGIFLSKGTNANYVAVRATKIIDTDTYAGLCIAVDPEIFSTSTSSKSKLGLKIASAGGLYINSGLAIDCSAAILTGGYSLNALATKVASMGDGTYDIVKTDRIEPKSSTGTVITLGAQTISIPTGTIKITSGDVIVGVNHTLSNKQDKLSTDGSGITLDSNNRLSIGKVVLGDQNQTVSTYSIVCGNSNSITSQMSLVVGNNNALTKIGTVMLGDYLQESTHTSKDKCVIIGKYNYIDNDKNYLFIVGNGIADTSRNNALYVTATGDLGISGDFSWTSSYSKDGYPLTLAGTTKDKANSVDLILNSLTSTTISLSRESKSYYKKATYNFTYMFDASSLAGDLIEAGVSFTFEFTLIVDVAAGAVVYFPTTDVIITDSGLTRQIYPGTNVYKILLVGSWDADNTRYDYTYFVKAFYIENPPQPNQS